MLPSNWTSSYNIQYRDWRSRLLAPHPAEPMFHFPGYTDPSHSRVSQGFWGQRAAAAQTARGELSANGALSSTTPLSSGGFAATYSSDSGRAQTAPAFAATTSAAPADAALAYRSAGYRSGPSTLPAINRERRDLWGADIKPLGGTYYDFNYAPAAPSVPRFAADPTVHGVADSYISSDGTSTRSSSAFIPDRSFNTFSTFEESRIVRKTGGQDVRYDSGAVGQTKHVDWGRVSEPRNKFHIPGYQGFVRGILFQHGDTYGKTTRSCLDVPFDVPQEP